MQDKHAIHKQIHPSPKLLIKLQLGHIGIVILLIRLILPIFQSANPQIRQRANRSANQPSSQSINQSISQPAISNPTLSECKTGLGILRLSHVIETGVFAAGQLCTYKGITPGIARRLGTTYPSKIACACMTQFSETSV